MLVKLRIQFDRRAPPASDQKAITPGRHFSEGEHAVFVSFPDPPGFA